MASWQLLGEGHSNVWYSGNKRNLFEHLLIHLWQTIVLVQTHDFDLDESEQRTCLGPLLNCKSEDVWTLLPYHQQSVYIQVLGCRSAGVDLSMADACKPLQSALLFSGRLQVALNVSVILVTILLVRTLNGAWRMLRIVGGRDLE